MVLDVFAVIGIFSLIVWLCIGIYKTTYFIEQLKYSMNKTDRLDSIIESELRIERLKTKEQLAQMRCDLLEDLQKLKSMIPKRETKTTRRNK